MSFRKPIYEAPGDAFARMSDDQFRDYQKKNPGAAEKAAQVRKQAQARANKSNNTSNNTSTNTPAKPSGKKEVGTSALAKRGGLVKSNSQGNQSNKVGGASDSKRVSSAGGKAVDMGVKKVKVRDVTPGQKKISGSSSSSDSVSGSKPEPKPNWVYGKKDPSDSSNDQRRPPSGAGQKEMTREKGGALAKYKKTGGPTNYTAKKNYVKAKRVADKVGAAAKSKLAKKIVKGAGAVGKYAIGNTAAAFGKSSWKKESKELKTFSQFMIESRGR